MSLIQIKRVLGMKWRGTGFSLTEMMATVALMGVIAGIASVSYVEYIHTATINQVKADSHTVKGKINTCFKYAGLYKSAIADQFNECQTIKQLGLMPCIKQLGQTPMNVSTACDELSIDSGSQILCVTLKWKKQNGCVRYDPSAKTLNRIFIVCVDPEDPERDTVKCSGTCDPKKGYECSSGYQCVCA